MKILLSEDDPLKRDQIRSVLLHLPKPPGIVCTRSFHSTVEALLREAFDIVILDMTMPAFDSTPDDDGGRHDPYAGREVLSEMLRYGIDTPVVVVTQFDRFGSGKSALRLAELDRELAAEFARQYRGFVFWESSSESWRTALTDILQKVIAEENRCARS